MNTTTQNPAGYLNDGAEKAKPGYRFANLRFNATAAEVLIEEYLRERNSEAVVRKDIVAEVSKRHVERGGVLQSAAAVENHTKKAFQCLVTEGKIVRPVVGFYRLHQENVEDLPLAKEEYRFQGLPFSMNAAELLVEEYFQEDRNRKAARKDLLSLIPSRHLERGGTPGAKPARAVINALQRMKTTGSLVSFDKHYQWAAAISVNGYPYQGMPLSWQAAEKLIEKYLQEPNVGAVKRADLFNIIPPMHVERGGNPTPEPVGVIKRALKTLKEEELIEPVVDGYYRWKRLEDAGSYFYRGIPFTMTVGRQLVKEYLQETCAAGKPGKIGKEIYSRHLSKGGVPNSADPRSMICDLLRGLLSEGLVDCVDEYYRWKRPVRDGDYPYRNFPFTATSARLLIKEYLQEPDAYALTTGKLAETVYIRHVERGGKATPNPGNVMPRVMQSLKADGLVTDKWGYWRWLSRAREEFYPFWRIPFIAAVGEALIKEYLQEPDVGRPAPVEIAAIVHARHVERGGHGTETYRGAVGVALERMRKSGKVTVFDGRYQWRGNAVGTEYPFCGAPLTKKASLFLIEEHLREPGVGGMRLKELVNEVVARHSERGGQKGRNSKSTISTAAWKMKKQGLVVVIDGYYRWKMDSVKRNYEFESIPFAKDAGRFLIEEYFQESGVNTVSMSEIWKTVHSRHLERGGKNGAKPKGTVGTVVQEMKDEGRIVSVADGYYRWKREGEAGLYFFREIPFSQASASYLIKEYLQESGVGTVKLKNLVKEIHGRHLRRSGRPGAKPTNAVLSVLPKMIEDDQIVGVDGYYRWNRVEDRGGYKYREIPFGVGTARLLIEEYLQTSCVESVKPGDVAGVLLSRHLDRGGLIASGNSTQAVQKAFRCLARAEIVESIDNAFRPVRPKESSEYEFKGVPLRTAAARPLIEEYLRESGGKPASAKTLSRIVKSRHAERGGIAGAEPANAVKRAVIVMLDDDLIIRVGRQYCWKVQGEDAVQSRHGVVFSHDAARYLIAEHLQEPGVEAVKLEKLVTTVHTLHVERGGLPGTDVPGTVNNVLTVMKKENLLESAAGFYRWGKSEKNGKYFFRGTPLNGPSAKPLIEECLQGAAGAWITLSDIIAKVVERHSDGGGIINGNADATVMRMLKVLLDEGEIERLLEYGYYRWKMPWKEEEYHFRNAPLPPEGAKELIDECLQEMGVEWVKLVELESMVYKRHVERGGRDEGKIPSTIVKAVRELKASGSIEYLDRSYRWPSAGEENKYLFFGRPFSAAAARELIIEYLQEPGHEAMKTWDLADAVHARHLERGGLKGAEPRSVVTAVAKRLQTEGFVERPGQGVCRWKQAEKSGVYRFWGVPFSQPPARFLIEEYLQEPEIEAKKVKKIADVILARHLERNGKAPGRSAPTSIVANILKGLPENKIRKVDGRYLWKREEKEGAYPYVGFPFTITVARALIEEYLQEPAVGRVDQMKLSETIVERHLKRGGTGAVTGRGKNRECPIIRAAGKALLDEGLIEQESGNWLWATSADRKLKAAPDGELLPVFLGDPATATGVVYCFFVKIWKKAASGDNFHIKIGMTENVNWIPRIRNQLLIDDLDFVFIFYASDPKEMERIIHAALDANGIERMKPGAELFFSTPKEVRSTLLALLKSNKVGKKGGQGIRKIEVPYGKSLDWWNKHRPEWEMKLSAAPYVNHDK